jgi:cysteine-rich repeat protein
MRPARFAFFFLALAMAIGGCSCGESLPPGGAVGIDLTVRYAAKLDIDALEVTVLSDDEVIAEGKLPEEGHQLGESKSRAELLLSSEWDGVKIAIRVDGLSEGEVVASELARATPRAGSWSEVLMDLGAPAVLGDGIVHDTLEECDDGNTNPGDGCHDGKVEEGYSCEGSPSVCSTDANPDAGPAPPDAGPPDAGFPPADGGAVISDSGFPPSDSGSPPADSGSPNPDSGTPVVDGGTLPSDSGSPTVDAGIPPVDGGLSPADSGTGAADSGMAAGDSGSFPPDAGPPITDAGPPPPDAGPLLPDAGSPADFVVLNEAKATGDDSIELYNLGDQAYDLTGWSISDSDFPPDEGNRYVMPPGTVIAPGGFLVFVQGTHQAWGLSGGGDTVRLFDENVVLVDTTSYGNMQAQTSWCRLPDGTGAFTVCTTSTLGFPNF